jgi:23S rRNA (guanosine2251-2'-O)-methyltransferase
VWAVGLAGEAELEIADCGLLTEPLVLVVGAEGSGLSALTARTCDQLVRLPMRGAVGSLNASVAAAVALYEVLRRR